MKKLEVGERKIVIFGFLFFLVALLPFIGLGNITSRYSYLSSVGFVVILAVFLRKLYLYLIEVGGKYAGFAGTIIIIIAYLMIQLFGLQKIFVDWRTAGEEARNFLISVEEYSKDSWIHQEMQFYFVNVPIRFGDAWIWPVGLKDAVWFTFKNPKLSVYTVSDVNSVFNQTKGSVNSHIFMFDGNGGVDEVVRSRTGQINLLNPPR